MGTPATDPAQLLASLLQTGQDLMAQFFDAGTREKAEQTQTQLPLFDLAAATQQFADMQQQLVQQMTAFWTGALGARSPAEDASRSASSADKRFAGEAWSRDPRYDLMRRTYLSYASIWQQAVESAPVDEKSKAKMRFDMRQILDATSPSNFFLTNPEAMQLAVETGGQSVAQGMRLFLEDLAKGRISNTDEGAFTVGVNLATTPGEVIYENDLIQLIQYSPSTEHVHARPLVIIPPCINKFYILDLQPDNSLVRYALEQGHTVFLVSWRNITAELGHLTWEDYLRQGVMRAIDVALDVGQVDKVNTLGFCVGGTLLASAIAVMKEQGQEKVASMTLLTTMLDYSDTGEIGALVSEHSVASREAAIGSGGVMHGKELALTFSSLRANDLMWQYVVNNYLKGKAPPAFDMLYWNADGTNLPGPMFCWYVRNTYLENNLREPGKTVQCGYAVELSSIDVPSFLYASREDHIVPWKTAYASWELLGGETTFVLGASGHIAGVINPAAKNKRNHWFGGELAADAEHWLETARSVSGSWWPQWSTWLERQAGPEIPARTSLGNQHYRSIEPAPGRYVMSKAD
jgi:polyhydroxyalkanoate synthase subunit PhaC